MSNNANHSKKRRRGRQDSSPASFSVALASGLAAAAASALLMLLILSGIVYSTPDPGSLILPAALAAFYISAFCGGFTAAFAMRGEPLLSGGLTGTVYFIAVLLLSLMLPGGACERVGVWASVGLHAVAVAFSLLGALAGTNIRMKEKRRPARR